MPRPSSNPARCIPVYLDPVRLIPAGAKPGVYPGRREGPHERPSYEVTTEPAIAEQRDLPWTLTRRLDAALCCGLAIKDAAACAIETGGLCEVSRDTLSTRSIPPTLIVARTIAGQRHEVDVGMNEGVLPGRDDVALGFDSSINLWRTYNAIDSRHISV
jgi:hypothetical protein